MINTDVNLKEGNNTTEERILQAAETEFLTKGFVAARTTAIAKAAGVTHAMLHYYYRSKEKLFGKVIEAKLTALAGTFIIDIDDSTSLADCVRKAVSSHFDFVCANPLLPRFLVTEVFSNDALMELFHEKMSVLAASTIIALQKKIDKALAAGECKQIDAINLLLDIVSLNVFPVLVAPMVCKVANLVSESGYDKYLEMRKKENITVILSRLFV